MAARVIPILLFVDKSSTSLQSCVNRQDQIPWINCPRCNSAAGPAARPFHRQSADAGIHWRNHSGDRSEQRCRVRPSGPGTAGDIDQAVQAAEGSRWRLGQAVAGREGPAAGRLSQAILDHAEELAQLESRDCGKPLKQARADVTSCARYFEFCRRPTSCTATRSRTSGVYGADVARATGSLGTSSRGTIRCRFPGAASAALAAGNACVVKPAEDACLSVSGSPVLAAGVGFPPARSTLSRVWAARPESLAEHAGIEHISSRARRRPGRSLRQARRALPGDAELGGKARKSSRRRRSGGGNAGPGQCDHPECGQTCSAGSRLLVEASAYERYWSSSGSASPRSGPPASDDLDCGPLIRGNQLERVRLPGRCATRRTAVAGQDISPPMHPPAGSINRRR